MVRHTREQDAGAATGHTRWREEGFPKKYLFFVAWVVTAIANWAVKRTCPPGTADAVRREAQHTAELVCSFLRSRSTRANNTEALPARAILPLAITLDLGAALRIKEWEKTRLRQHIAADLPAGDDALRSVHDELLGHEAPEWLAAKVFTAWMRSFAIPARGHIKADVVLSGMDNGKLDDNAVERLADFLWTHRHAGQMQDRAGGEHGRTQ